ncbi:hypothetical protein JKP88DRAFT_309382 [Tribonema minus]|uniref:Uncharacterized protein n=1 Tax=Tribonema minus TaxID=303371 RepID=A0A835Z405_9STRA|nr:hypothetical protein JKP88DRAFT_309382 [Tribonema minus]
MTTTCRADSVSYKQQQPQQQQVGAWHGEGPEEKDSLSQITDVLQWIRSYPVVATVLWVCGKVVAGADHDARSFDRSDDRPSEISLNASGSVGSTTSSSSNRGGSPPVRKNSRKGLTRRLSWNDEHGGTLAEYFEAAMPAAAASAAATAAASSDDSDGDSDALVHVVKGDDIWSEALPQESSGAHARRRCGSGGGGARRDGSSGSGGGARRGGGGSGGLGTRAAANAALQRGSSTFSSAVAEVEPLDGALLARARDAPRGSLTPSVGSWSPQWGWYVTMTPPQESFPRSAAAAAAAAAATAPPPRRALADLSAYRPPCRDRVATAAPVAEAEDGAESDCSCD